MDLHGHDAWKRKKAHIFQKKMVGFWWWIPWSKVKNQFQQITLPKFNMEPENDGFQKGISYSWVPFSGSMLNFGRVLNGIFWEEFSLLKLPGDVALHHRNFGWIFLESSSPCFNRDSTSFKDHDFSACWCFNLSKNMGDLSSRWVCYTPED